MGRKPNPPQTITFDSDMPSIIDRNRNNCCPTFTFQNMECYDR